MDTTFAELVILASAVLVQEERPFQMPFLAPAHESPNYRDYLEEKTSIQERLKDVKREWAERKTPDKPDPQKKSL